jgi:hypothetical protein
MEGGWEEEGRELTFLSRVVGVSSSVPSLLFWMKKERSCCVAVV